MEGKRKRYMAALLTGTVLALLSGCRQKVSQERIVEEAKERKVIVYKSKEDAGDTVKQMIDAAFTKKTGIEVEVRVLSGNSGEEFQRSMDLDIITGGDGDVIFCGNNRIMCKYTQSGLLLPLDGLIEVYGDDVSAKYGDYLKDAKNRQGQIVGLPSECNTWAVYYNKKVFDEAGVPYPEGEWTWSEYVETARKLTDPEKGIYGSFMLDYDNYYFGYAFQLGISPYKEDGTSNYDAPEFAEALAFYKSLGTEYAVQPSYIEFITKKLSWDSFMSGNYGMMYISSWFLETLANMKDYPRDWEFGIVRSPVPDEAGNPFNMVSVGFYGVVKNGENHEEAYEYIRYMADHAYKISGRIPAKVNLTNEEWNEIFLEIVEKSGNNVTADEIRSALANNGMKIVSEKITGSIPGEYSNIIKKNADRYFRGEQTLKETVEKIKLQADASIKSLE